MARKYKFPKVLNDLLAANDITQADLSRQLGISQATISSWICGKKFPTLPMLIDLADYFHVSIDYLVHDNYYG